MSEVNSRLKAISHAKTFGQFFTPENVARTLVQWALTEDNHRLLDPSCGDGEFLACHAHAVGVEVDPKHASAARLRAPSALVHGGADFFEWAEHTHERFEAVVGNPPFIRYQGFAGASRERALLVARRIGAQLPQLTSSWAPFVAAAASLLKTGGRLSFVVPAEIGHASYASPLLVALCKAFERVHVVAIKKKLFPQLSEDAWILHCEGRGGLANGVDLSIVDAFAPSEAPPPIDRHIPLAALGSKRGRLRRWLLPPNVLAAYEAVGELPGILRLGEAAYIGIGYVTGANDFFHLRPSEVRALGIPKRFLKPAVRKGESLPPAKALTTKHVAKWISSDEAVFLLHLSPDAVKERSVRKYLASPEAEEAQTAYKCRVREPWYIVPNVVVPSGFLTYMSGSRVALIQNGAECVGTNSVHVVSMNPGYSFRSIQHGWDTPLARLSCELEGHPLGGGMLKVEPREAQSIIVPVANAPSDRDIDSLCETGISVMREWRHFP